jgi:hypothetical protein
MHAKVIGKMKKRAVLQLSTLSKTKKEYRENLKNVNTPPHTLKQV